MIRLTATDLEIRRETTQPAYEICEAARTRETQRFLRAAGFSNDRGSRWQPTIHHKLQIYRLKSPIFNRLFNQTLLRLLLPSIINLTFRDIRNILSFSTLIASQDSEIKFKANFSILHGYYFLCIVIKNLSPILAKISIRKML